MMVAGFGEQVGNDVYGSLLVGINSPRLYFYSVFRTLAKFGIKKGSGIWYDLYFY